MDGFRNVGLHTVSIFAVGRSFLTFLGRFSFLFFKMLTRKKFATWSLTYQTLYLTGVRLFFPIILVSGLLAFSLSLSISGILSQFFLQNQAFQIILELIINLVAPPFIALIIAMQSALNLIDAKVHKLQHSDEEVILDYVMPIIMGIFISGLILYTYAIFMFLLSTYGTFQFVLQINTQENWQHLSTYISLAKLVNSYLKFLMYCTIVGLIVGYYYYRIGIRQISVRKAVSRIMTRSLLFIILDSAALNFMNL